MKDHKFLRLNNIEAYKEAYHLSNYLWQIIIRWGYFNRKAIGLQFIQAIDSISANLAEGFGRYHKKDKINFYYYSLGSVKESLDWLIKAKVRKLISQKQYELIFIKLESLPKKINSLIFYTNCKLKK
jgi:four helix bundle protein